MKTIKLPVKTFKIKWVDKEQLVQSRLCQVYVKRKIDLASEKTAIRYSNNNKMTKIKVILKRAVKL